MSRTEEHTLQRLLPLLLPLQLCWFFVLAATFTYCFGSEPCLFQSFCVWCWARALGVSLLLFSFNVPEVGAVFCCEFVKRDAESRFFACVFFIFPLFFRGFPLVFLLILVELPLVVLLFRLPSVCRMRMLCMFARI